jgi:hypothetical protein
LFLWITATFLVAGAMSLALPRGRPAAGFAFGIVLVVVPAALLKLKYQAGEYALLRLAGYGLLSGAMGLAAGRAASRVKRRCTAPLGAIALLGGLIALAGLTEGLATRLYCWWYGMDFAAFARYSPPLRRWFNQQAILVGALLMAAGGVGLYLQRRAQQEAVDDRRPPPRSANDH